MAQPIKIINNQKDYLLKILWNPNNVCNYKCRYCWPENNSGTHKSPKDFELLVDNFDHMLTQYGKVLNKKKFHFMIAGGEPTLWKDLGKFMQEFKKRFNTYFTIVSNGSRTPRWWKQHASEIDDAHLTLHIAEGNVDHMIEIADILHAAGTKTTVKVLMDPEHWDKGVRHVDTMKLNSKHPWFIEVAEVIEDDNVHFKTDAKRYSEDQLKYIMKGTKRMPGPLWFWKNRHLFKEHIKFYESRALLDDGKYLRADPGTYINRNQNHFEGWKCDIGLETVYIDWAGEIKGSCNANVFNRKPYYNILDNNFKNEFRVVNESVICPFKSCFCSPETHVSKSMI
jgi:organic radical activating enzyme